MAGEEIRYVFTAVGADSIASSFASIGQAAERSGVKVEGSYRRSGAAAKQGLTETQKLALRVAADQERAAVRAGRAQETAAKQQQAAAQRASSAIKREADKSAKAQEAAAQRGAKAEERAAQQRVKATKAAEEKRWKEVERSSKQIERALEREAAAAERAARRKAKAEEQVAKKRSAAIAHGARVGIGLAAAGAAGVAGVLGKAAGDSLHTQDAANRISVAGGRKVDPGLLRKEIEATAVAHAGQTGESVAGGIAAFQTHRGGDKGKALDEARQYSDVIATVSSATGKSAEDIGKASALLAKRGDIKTVDEMGEALASLVAHARESGQPLDEAISHLDKMGAMAKRVGLTGAKGAAQLGALQVLGAEGAGAGMGDKAVEGFFKKITQDKTARSLKAAGVDPYADKNGNLQDPRKFLEGLYSKVGSDKSASDKTSTINKQVGPMGAKMLDPLNKAYSAAYGAATGTDKEKVKAGVDAMLAAFDKAAAQTGSYADLQASAAQIEQGASQQLEAAWQKVVSAAGDELVPVLTNLAKELAHSPDAFKAVIEAAKIMASALGSAAWVINELFGKGNRVKGNESEEDWENKAKMHEGSIYAIKNKYHMQGKSGSKEEQNEIAAEEMAIGVARSAAKRAHDAAGNPPPVNAPGAAPPVHGPAAPAYMTDPMATGRAPAAGQTHAATDAAAGKLVTAADKLAAAADKLGAKGSIYGGRTGQALNGS